MPRVLVVEDDRSARRTLQKFLSDQGYEVELAEDGETGASRIQAGGWAVVLLDLGLPRLEGLDVLARVAETTPRPPPIIVVSARDDMDSTVQAMQRGAYDYLMKPLDIDQLLRVIERATEEHALRENADSSEHHATDSASTEPLLVGRSPTLREVFKIIGQVSQTPAATVLITGESGTGKELVARAIHAASTNRDRPFVAFNCAALPAGLVESELFGHVRGAFTGASIDKPGRLEVAGEGTVLLDELGELELDLQAKLLRVLQERSFERVGDVRSLPLRARIVATTHRHLGKMVEEGRFREDLYYRLRVVEIALPPLRERTGDVSLLIDKLLVRVSRDAAKETPILDPEARALLEAYRWPGNVRELHNVLSRAVVLARGSVITPATLPDAVRGAARRNEEITSLLPTSIMSLAEVEKQHIRRVLEHTNWKKVQAADILGVSRPTLDRKIREYDLSPER